MANDTPSKPTIPPARSFRFAVGPLSWEFRAGDGIEPWLGQLARILEADPQADGAPVRVEDRRMLFFRLDPGDAGDSSGSNLEKLDLPGWPRTGWRPLWLYPVRIWKHPGFPHVVCETMLNGLESDASIEAMMRAFFPVFEGLAETGGLPLHAALVARGGFGVVLAASGGTGKSTCARRIPSPWRPLCDDTVLLVPDGGRGFRAHPFPTWSDYLWKRSEGTWNLAESVPLKAIFLLKQAEEDKASAIGQGEAAIYLSRSANDIVIPFARRLIPEENRTLERRVFDNACRLAKALPAFILEFSREGEFWREIDRVLG